jgi:hypothetical protein
LVGRLVRERAIENCSVDAEIEGCFQNSGTNYDCRGAGTSTFRTVIRLRAHDGRRYDSALLALVAAVFSDLLTGAMQATARELVGQVVGHFRKVSLCSSLVTVLVYWAFKSRSKEAIAVANVYRKSKRIAVTTEESCQERPALKGPQRS